MRTYEATVVVSAHATVRFTTDLEDVDYLAGEIALNAVTWDVDDLPENVQVPGGWMELDLVDVNEVSEEVAA